MKKILLVGLLASGLFADQCNFWLGKVVDSSKMMNLSLEDGAKESFLVQYEMYMEYSRYALVHCSNDIETLNALKSSRELFSSVAGKLR